MLDDKDIQTKIDVWTSGNFDQDTKSEIKKLQENNPKSLRDAFYTDLTFGTGGLRGLMGVGPNRMNIYTVRRATLGLANYIKQNKGKETPKVVIGFDSRNNSQLFAEEAAKVLAAQEIEVFLLQDLRPTPFISFACREMNCIAAIMITASHNPSDYNGYKVYWSDGGQIVPPHDKGIMQNVLSITTYDDIPVDELDSSLIHIITDKLDEKYLEAIRPLQLKAFDNISCGRDLHIVYSSLHGAGITLVPQALKDWGFSNVFLVDEQCIPNGDFPTVQFPNPEYPEALELGIKKMQNSASDILFVTDPDADRLGVVVMHKGRPVILNGNETASICSWYLCSVLQKTNKLSKKHAIVSTIVSTDLIPEICKDFGVHCELVLTGFKYIGEKIYLWQKQEHGYEFLFGAEESYGYLVGTHSRDKDAVVSCCLLAEIALFAKKMNMTLVDLLHEIYLKYGLFREAQYSIDFPPGKDGIDTMNDMMQHLRAHPMNSLLSSDTAMIEDYKTSERTFINEHKKTKIDLPRSDVLLYRFTDGSKIVIRPSGTEPKLKIYAGVKLTNFLNIQDGINQCDEKIQSLISAVKQKFSRA